MMIALGIFVLCGYTWAVGRLCWTQGFIYGLSFSNTVSELAKIPAPVEQKKAP